MFYSDSEEKAILKAANFPSFVSIDEVKAAYQGRCLGYGHERFYHDWNHALSVLSWVNHVCDSVPLDEHMQQSLRLAALFHDVVYKVKNGSPQNEEDSCTMLKNMHDVHKAQHNRLIVDACDLIMATAKHGKVEANQVSLAESLLMDCDISNLGSPQWDVVLWNNENVVKELATIYTPEQYNPGRRKFLEGMLKKRSIYLSEYFRSKYEHQARRNIQRLIDETLPYEPA